MPPIAIEIIKRVLGELFNAKPAGSDEALIDNVMRRVGRTGENMDEFADYTEIAQQVLEDPGYFQKFLSGEPVSGMHPVIERFFGPGPYTVEQKTEYPSLKGINPNDGGKRRRTEEVTGANRKELRSPAPGSGQNDDEKKSLSLTPKSLPETPNSTPGNMPVPEPLPEITQKIPKTDLLNIGEPNSPEVQQIALVPPVKTSKLDTDQDDANITDNFSSPGKKGLAFTNAISYQRQGNIGPEVKPLGIDTHQLTDENSEMKSGDLHDTALRHKPTPLSSNPTFIELYYHMKARDQAKGDDQN